jgi:hypothetical protein
MKPGCSLTRSQEPATCYVAPRTSAEALWNVSQYNKILRCASCQHLDQPPSWRITLCRLSATVYSIYSQLSSTSGRAMLWRQWPPCPGSRSRISEKFPFDFRDFPGEQKGHSVAGWPIFLRLFPILGKHAATLVTTGASGYVKFEF